MCGSLARTGRSDSETVIFIFQIGSFNYRKPFSWKKRLLHSPLEEPQFLPTESNYSSPMSVGMKTFVRLTRARHVSKHMQSKMYIYRERRSFTRCPGSSTTSVQRLLMTLPLPQARTHLSSGHVDNLERKQFLSVGCRSDACRYSYRCVGQFLLSTVLLRERKKFAFNSKKSSLGHQFT